MYQDRNHNESHFIGHSQIALRRKIRITHSKSILIGSFIFLFALNSCTSKKQEPAGQKGRRGGPVLVEVRVAQPELLLNTVSATGSVMANEKAEIRPEVSGRIINILFEEGATVSKNKLLVKLNDSDLQAQLKRNEAQALVLTSDESQKRKLLELKAISQDEYDLAKSALLVNQADKQLLQAQIAKTEVYAPFTGKVGLRTVSVGNYVASNTLIATIQQLDPIKIEFDIPEKYIGFVNPGMEITFRTDASDSIYAAKVYAVESSISTETRTLKIRARCANPSGELKPGTFARVDMILERFPDAIKIPSEAVLTELNGNRVYVCKGGKAQMTPVTTGIRTDSEIQILSGIVPGDSLIITGLMQLANGAPVVVKKKKADQPAEPVGENK